MMKLHELIAALQDQQKKHGDIEISIDIVPRDDQPKEGYSRYLHVFGPWYANAQDGQRPSFTFNEDKEAGDWLGITFENGLLQGEFERLDRKGLRYEVEKDGKLDSRKPKH